MCPSIPKTSGEEVMATSIAGELVILTDKNVVSDLEKQSCESTSYTLGDAKTNAKLLP